MSTLKVNTIQDTTGNDAISIGSDGSAGFVQTQMSHRNLLINGAMQVWQRGTSFSSSSSDIHAADRWAINSIGSTSRSVDRVFNTDTQSYALKMTLAGSGNVQIIQKIEGFKQFHNKAITVSFDVKSTVASTVYIGLRTYHSSGSDAFDNTSVSCSSTMSRVTATFDAQDLSSYTENSSSYMRFEIQPSSGVSGEYIEFTNVQVEFGSVATPFEHRSYGEELARCQRYYFSTYSEGQYPGDNTVASGNLGIVLSANSSKLVSGGMTLPSSMRASPTLTKYSPTGTVNNYYERHTATDFNAGSGYHLSTQYIAYREYDGSATANREGFIHVILDAEL